MQMTRRAIFEATGGLTILGAGRSLAESSTVNRQVRAVVGFPPGGAADTVMRLYAEHLRAGSTQQVVVENRPGAGGRVAVDVVKAARPDGATFLHTPASTLIIYPHTYAHTIRYDALTDFIPVSPVCISSLGLAVRADHPARTLGEFAEWARKQSDAVPFASPAAGSMPHFLSMQLARTLSIQLTHVPYRGTAAALQDLLGGQIPAVSCTLGDLTELYRANRVRILYISAPERLASLPEIPTLAELGYPEVTAEEWFGFLLPARTPLAIVNDLNQAILAAAAMPGLQDALARLEYRVMTSSPTDFAARIRAERDRWGPIVAASGFKPEE